MADISGFRPTSLNINDRSLDRFVTHLFDALHFFETVDPYDTPPDPREPYLGKADAFLRKHAGIGYQELLKLTPVRQLTEEDYALISPRFKKSLFDYRARLYLAALDSCDREGIPIPELLPKIRDATIPPIKREAREPTFELLLRYLNA